MGGWQCHQRMVERRIAEGEDWVGPHPRMEREPSDGEAGGKWSVVAEESEKSRRCPSERGEGGSQGEEGAQAG